MKIKWLNYAVTLSLFAGLLLPAGQTNAASTNVKVTLPTFEVKLNGHLVENRNREYPLLVYRGITYIPMTWNDTRLLGLEASWSQAAGLNIQQSQVTSSYEPYKTESRNAAAYTAKISTSAITVNGKKINNSKEPYPLLSFRNITYFPLTWRFAHDEFGWDYKWNTDSGLSITSHNPQLQSVGLPSFAADNGVALFEGYYYFVQTSGTTNRIYRSPVKQPSAKEEIYSYSFEGSGEEWQPEKVTFQIRDKALWFTYHLGGGVSGSDRFVKIEDNGEAKMVHDGYLDFRDTPYGTLIVDLGFNYDDGTLYFEEGSDRVRVGDPDLSFAQYVTQNGLTATTVVGDDVYVLCQPLPSDPYSIYRINLKTNKTEKIVDASVSWFRILDNKLYYINKDDNQALYSSKLDGTNAMKLSEHAVSWFDSVDGNLFYTTKLNSTQYALYKLNSNGEDVRVWASPVASVQVVDHYLISQLGSGSGVVLLEGSGRLSLKVADPISRVVTSEDGVILQSEKNTFYKINR
ncbi:DUF5050 domain-containing protein [Paenibacillus soyae]|uniref:DUF5050 domain-containing protein n=1 Tax=Paenibacillus soyae TaxID=2969249 RepID=A0A9X2MTR7_9BACL|nr:DUF5050 domain-containing protein [Paenibacillus soyae]MCR2805606.1 DUF5050 domain-containing protein [Paenibacillus soyae]